MLFLGLSIGTSVGSLFVSTSDGLAAPAIALGYGAVGMGIALVVVIIMFRKMKSSQLQVALIITGVLSIGGFGLLYNRYQTKQKARMEQQEKDNERYKDRKPTEVAPNAID